MRTLSKEILSAAAKDRRKTRWASLSKLATFLTAMLHPRTSWGRLRRDGAKVGPLGVRLGLRVVGVAVGRRESEGVIEGAYEGNDVEGDKDGVYEGICEGAYEGSLDGSLDGF